MKKSLLGLFNKNYLSLHLSTYSCSLQEKGIMDDRAKTVAIGIAISFAILGLFMLICLVQICCKKLDCCKKLKIKKPSIKDKMMKKVGLMKLPPFSISSIVDKK